MAEDRLVDVYVAQSIADRGGAYGFGQAHASTTVCFNLRQVQWRDAQLSADGQEVICHFRAPDAESVRLSLRRAGIPFERVWTGA